MKADEQTVKEIIMMSIYEVFEKMYYIFLETRGEELMDGKREIVQIQFSGALEGELSAYFSEPLAQVMIENALGLEEEEITAQIREDCLKESINMICGSFLQKYEPDKVVQLSIPRFLGKAPAPGARETAGSIHLAFEADGMVVDAVLRISGASDEK